MNYNGLCAIKPNQTKPSKTKNPMSVVYFDLLIDSLEDCVDRGWGNYRSRETPIHERSYI